MGLNQRNARLSDAAPLLEWRNSSNARAFSQNSSLIEVEEHFAWLLDRLERIETEPFYIFEVGHELVGMCRLDFESRSDNKMVISILVDPRQQRNGLGTRILEMTCKNFLDQHPSYTIVAKIHRDNLVSQKLFSNAGFAERYQVDDFLRFELTT
jgi:RimJ/RimL family protein N-acetyltransferase